jgi:hypothetical protein
VQLKEISRYIIIFIYLFIFCLNITVCGFRASINVYEFGVYVNYTSQIFYEFNVVLTVHNVVHQHSETNMMHFLFSLLRINGFYFFRALLAHPRETLHKRRLVVYCVRVISVDCTRVKVEI